MYWEWNEKHFATPYRVKMQACRRGKWKIVRNDVAQPWELYDLEQDPGEKRDLAVGHPGVGAELEAWVIDANLPAATIARLLRYSGKAFLVDRSKIRLPQKKITAGEVGP